MKSRLIPILLTCACASLARADFNPVALTPSSYTFDIVVEASTVEALPYCINVTVGNGLSLGDNTYYEQGLRARAGQPGGNSGVPIHNTTFNSINNANMAFVMPPDYTTNNDLMIDSAFTSGTFVFNAATTATNLAVLGTGGGGATTVGYTVTHADASTETGSLTFLDWFSGGATVAWGANGRITSGGGYNNFNASAVNNNPPYLYANQITVSGASPIVNITFNYTSGQHANLFAVSGNAAGANWTPIPLGGFNVKALVPAAFPLTATMDQGTNTAYNGNLATWFESGFVRNVSGGLPVSGSTFTSFTQPTHTYQMGNYSANNAILIDTNHQIANITPVSPTNYSAFALLTAGGNAGGGQTNIIILQHQDGVNETNNFYGYDWFDNNHNGSIALQGNGRVNMASRTVNNVGNNYPYLFETYFVLSDVSSPVTNIVLQYGSAANPSSTTYVMAVSAASGGVPPVVDSGPTPSTQTRLLGQTATFTVGVSGTAPITGFWTVQNNGSYFPLTDGVDANGSTIIGSQTMTLTISNVFLADGTNYQYVASNAYGTNSSANGLLIVTPQLISITPANPVYYTSNSIPLTVNLSAGPAVNLQWYYIDNAAVSNSIPGATNVTYTITNAPLSFSGYTYGVVATNVYGTNSASVVLSISDSAAFLAGDLKPLNAEAYHGAPVTYTVNAQGNSPITYQWMVNGSVVSGATAGSFTLPAPCGTNTIQVAFSNDLSGGILINSSTVVLQGDSYPTNITFNTDGTGWQTNGSVPLITNNVLRLTDGGGGEGSSAFFNVAQYVGGTWTASFTYNSNGGGADGTAFILQNMTNATALGGSGGSLGYNGISNSVAFEINLYPGNGQTIGIGLGINGSTGVYQATGPVSVNSTNPINVTLSWNSGVLAVTLKDAVTLATYSTNYTVGSLIPILGGNLAYVGFSGADGGVTSVQTVGNFQFHSTLPPVNLTVSPVTANSFVISWPTADPNYVLQMTSSLSAPAWAPAPAPVVVGGFNQVTVNVTGNGQQFYRLLRVACQ